MHTSKQIYLKVIDIAQQAGSKIMAIYNRDFAVEQKQDNSPLTAADMAAHRHIVSMLQALTPDIPVLSEESGDIAWQTRQKWQEYWLVDPLDGTKEFIKRNNEFTVNIAHIVDGEPVWGVVVAPALELTYWGGVVSGISQKCAAGRTQTIQVSELPEGRSGWQIVGSRSHQSEAFKAFVQQYSNPVITGMGSSLKICLIAEGAAHLYPRLGPTCEWDTAAAHAVLKGAGGKLVHADSLESLRYNQQDSLLNPHFIAAAQSYTKEVKHEA